MYHVPQDDAAAAVSAHVHVTMPHRLIANLSLEGVRTFLKTAHKDAASSPDSNSDTGSGPETN